MSHFARFLRTTLTATLLCAVLTVSAAALNYGSGVVNASALHLRETPGTGTTILTTVIKGTEVVVMENQTDGWYKVNLDGTVGYMSADYLSVTQSTYTDILNTDGFSLNLRSGPGTNYNKVESIPSGAALIITGIQDGWYETSYNGVKGYVSSDYVKLTDDSAEEPSTTEKPVKIDLGSGTPNTNGISLNMRSGPGTNYDMIDSIPFGATLKITAEENGWYKTSYEGNEGYVSSDYITLIETEPEPSTGTLNTDGASLNLRSGPGTNFDKLTTIPADAVLTITDNEDGWYKVSYGGAAGYVSSDYVVLSSASNGSSSSNKGSSSNSNSSSSNSGSSNSGSSSTSANAGSTSSGSSLGSQIVSYAKQFLGIPYVYGANGPRSYDCSSFTQTVFKHFGYTLNRSAAGQYKNGTAIELSQVKPGDILLWRSYGSSKTATHVGIYIGNNMYIHASSSGGCITINDMSYGTNARYLVGVRRIID